MESGKHVSSSRMIWHGLSIASSTTLVLELQRCKAVKVSIVSGGCARGFPFDLAYRFKRLKGLYLATDSLDNKHSNHEEHLLQENQQLAKR